MAKEKDKKSDRERDKAATAPVAGKAARGGSARATFAVLELAARSVTEGLLHPQLQHGGRTWLAYWGATIDEPIQEALDAIAAALPAVCADACDGDREALVHDLYSCAVDQIARDRLRLRGSGWATDSCATGRAPELFLDGLTSTEPERRPTPASAP
jgi:hypothetical protein